MSYKGLKKIINSLIQEKAQISVTIAASPPPGSEPAAPPEDENSTFLQLQKAAFFFKLERELEKVITIVPSFSIVINCACRVYSVRRIDPTDFDNRDPVLIQF